MFNWLYTAVSWVLLQWHHFFSFVGVDKASGLNWALSIVFLVITARLLLFRLFIKQVKYQRHMQTVQPKMQALRKKYKDDKAELQRQMMKLQQEEGFNPLAGCLPMFLQLPVFWGLYHTLRHLSNSVYSCNNHRLDPHLTLYGFSQTETCNGAKSNIFGAPLAARLTDPVSTIHTLGGEVTVTRIVVLILVIISASATFTTQLLVRRAQVTTPEGTAATIQRFMLFGVPLGTLGSGLFFPLGVLLYWFTSNTWTMGQQLYINKFHPQAKPEDKPTASSRAVTPRPGQRPVRPGRGPAQTTSLVKEPPVDTVEDVAEAGADAGAAPPPRSAPRPGQRPQRSNRPPANRPSKAKKRR